MTPEHPRALRAPSVRPPTVASRLPSRALAGVVLALAVLGALGFVATFVAVATEQLTKLQYLCGASGSVLLYASALALGHRDESSG